MSKTSLNGYSYGKNPTTDAPFWGEGGSGGGAVINDETTALDSTWSSSKISSELATKANATDVYDKTEVDEALAYKADADEVYDKTTVDMKLADKADKSDTYTKTQVDTALADKADASTTYTKTEVNAELATKADKSDTYTKAEMNIRLGAKADLDDVYRKPQVDSALDEKADKSNTYTKSQVDSLISGAGGGAAIDDTTTSTTSVWSSKKTSDELATKADASTTYTKSEVNRALGGKADWDEVYRKSQVDTLLDDKADKSNTYTKTQVDDLIAGAGGGGSAIPTNYSKIRANNVNIGYSNHDASNYVYGDVIDFNLSITIDGKTNTPHALVRYIGNQYIPQGSPSQEFTPVVLTDPSCTVYVAANNIFNDGSDLVLDLYLYYPSDYTVTAFTATHAHHREWGTQRIREGVYTKFVDASDLTSLASGHKAAVELTVQFVGEVREYTYYALLNSAADNHIVNGHYFGNFVSCEALAPKYTVSGNKVQATYDAPDIKVALFNDSGTYYIGFILPQNVVGVNSLHVSVLQSY